MFIDFTAIECQAGNGGAGAVTFRREKFVPKGGPNGGDGGAGGNIIVVADVNLRTLRDIRYNSSYKAQNGEPGASNQKSGKQGTDLFIPVPQGTIIRNADDNEIIADLVEPNARVVLCQGGKGGLGNQHFKTPQNRSPRYAQPGLPGTGGRFQLELKVLADVGLVGLPNAGKSTFLSRVSAARPKIADYPFTTLEPHLGIVKYGEYKSFIMADIPGLIEGASTGKGLGIQFLRHIERTRILVILIDVQEESPESVYQILLGELSGYSPILLQKKRLIVRTKLDTLDTENKSAWENVSFSFMDISSVTGAGIPEVISRIAVLIDGTS